MLWRYSKFRKNKPHNDIISRIDPYENDPYLYILMRTDMASMNPGKSVAQGAHAANQFVNEIQTKFAQHINMFKAWENSTTQGFGVTITLGVNEEQLRSIIANTDANGFACGITHDPSYPLRDGQVIHLLPLDTCGYVFGIKKDLKPHLADLKLMP